MFIATKQHIYLYPASSTYLAEASDLGLKPGEWPETITIEQGPGESNIVFEKNRQIQKGGWQYVQQGGRFTLEVLND